MDGCMVMPQYSTYNVKRHHDQRVLITTSAVDPADAAGARNLRGRVGSGRPISRNFIGLINGHFSDHMLRLRVVAIIVIMSVVQQPASVNRNDYPVALFGNRENSHEHKHQAGFGNSAADTETFHHQDRKEKSNIDDFYRIIIRACQAWCTCHYIYFFESTTAIYSREILFFFFFPSLFALKSLKLCEKLRLKIWSHQLRIFKEIQSFVYIFFVFYFLFFRFLFPLFNNLQYCLFSGKFT